MRRFGLALQSLVLLPNSLPVFRLMRCGPVQALQTTTSYSVSGTSGSASDQCWTFIRVAGQVKTTFAIIRLWRLCNFPTLI